MFDYGYGWKFENVDGTKKAKKKNDSPESLIFV